MNEQQMIISAMEQKRDQQILDEDERVRESSLFILSLKVFTDIFLFFSP